MQFAEVHLSIQSDNGTITRQHGAGQLTDLFIEAMSKTRDLQAPSKLKAMMGDAGLIELESKYIQIPLNGWSAGMSKSFFRRRLLVFGGLPSLSKGA